ncbi:hypothetical protein Taro_036233, partial [Colocasia esculenta]|nr:hypothetical protein [Colocasia esculenta]
TSVVLTPSGSRPTNDFVGLVSYSGDTREQLRWPGFIIWGRRLCGRHQLQDPRMTSLAWFHIQVTPFMLTPSASRPPGDSVGMVLSSGDVGYVDVDSFKTHE